MVGYERGQYAVVSDVDLYWGQVDSPYPAALGGLTRDLDIDSERFTPFLASAHKAVSHGESYSSGVHEMNKAAAHLLAGQPVEEAVEHVQRYVNEEGPEYALERIMPENVLGPLMDDADIHVSGRRERLKPESEVVTGLRNLSNAGVNIALPTDIPHPFSPVFVREGLELEDAYLLAGTLETENGYFTGGYTPVHDKAVILRHEMDGRRIIDHDFVEGVGDSPRDVGYVSMADRGRQKIGEEMRNYDAEELCSQPHVVCMGTAEPQDFVEAIFSDIQRDLFSSPSAGRARGTS